MIEEFAEIPLPALSINALMEHSRNLCLPKMRNAVSRLASPMDTVAAYHFGWVNRHGRPAAGDGGKMLRPALAVLAARAIGVNPLTGILGGVSVELVHNFSLLHDDFMDGDETRRHRATAWTVFSPTLAILTGDALLNVASDVLVGNSADDISPHNEVRALKLLTSATQKMIDGQVRDLSFELRDRISVEECLEMVSEKTGALLACSSAISAALAGADDDTVNALGSYGHHLGLAFQAVDDLLGIWGDPESTGKSRWGDLRRRKKSLPVCAALAENCKYSRQLADVLSDACGSGNEDEKQLEQRAFLIEAAGGRAWTYHEARRQHAKALEALDEVAMPDAVREYFTMLARFAIERNK